MKNSEESIVWSALAFVFGSVILLFGFELHNAYKFGSKVNDALHIHYPAGLMIVIGLVIAVVGLLGIISALVNRQK